MRENEALAGDDSELTHFKEKYVESMERMFAAVSGLYAQYWGDFFHLALFNDDSETWEAALRNTHEKYIEALRVRQAANVLDLACGRGGFSDVLAQNTEGNVLGIDISRSQLLHCRRFKRSNLRFKHHDIMKVDELGGEFDAVALLDADCYLPDKRLAVERIASVMRPGARFLLLSWCKRDGLSRLQEELVLHPFMRYWAIPSLETPKNYKRYFEQSGLRILEIADLNDRVRRNWELGYERALKAAREFSLKDAARLIWKGVELGPDGLKLLKEQFPAAVYIKVGFDVGFLRYVYCLVERK